MSGAMTAIGTALGAGAASAAAVGTMATMATVGAATSLYTSSKQASATKAAAKQASADSAKAAKQQEEATNRANSKSPDVGAMLSANMQNALSGQSGTLLTGASGVDPNTLSLGKNALLGG